jgi:hypothetical protein
MGTISDWSHCQKAEVCFPFRPPYDSQETGNDNTSAALPLDRVTLVINTSVKLFLSICQDFVGQKKRFKTQPARTIMTTPLAPVSSI